MNRGLKEELRESRKETKGCVKKRIGRAVAQRSTGKRVYRCPAKRRETTCTLSGMSQGEDVGWKGLAKKE